MATYEDFTCYELEQMQGVLSDALMKCDDEEQLDNIQIELDAIQDELDSRDLLEED